MIACSLSGYFIHSLSTLYYYSAPSLATQLTGDYCDRTHTGKYGPAWLDTQKDVKNSLQTNACRLFHFIIYILNLFLAIDIIIAY